jgi:tetratricopeptide (TPR) repeat protein
MQVRHLALAASLVLWPPVIPVGAALAQAGAQAGLPSAEHIKLGDQAYVELKPAEAIGHYQAAIAADSTNYEALWKAARSEADLAEFATDVAQQRALYASAVMQARRAIAVEPQDAEGHFELARALGRVALTLGARDRVKYAKEVRDQALEALKHDPNHAGALHVMGRWNAEVMRLSGFTRFMAKSFLGGQVFNSASWSEARRYMERAVEADPERLTHHLDLGAVYADMGDTAKAREQFELVARGAVRDYNDPHYKEQAEAGLIRLR